MRKPILTLSVAALAALAGCAPLDAGYLAMKAADGRPTVNATSEVAAINGQQVYPAEVKKQGPMWDKGCVYKGNWVRYYRNWDTMSEDGTRVLFKADSTKPFGYALLVYEERCPTTAAPKAVLYTSQPRTSMWVGLNRAGLVAIPPLAFTLENYLDPARVAERPKWMAQVVKTIQSEAPSNPAAQAFLSHVKIEGGLPVAVKE
jgi:hypothetical protein